MDNGVLSRLTITNCTLSALVGQPIMFNAAMPNGTYKLDLARPEQRAVALQLVEVRVIESY